MEDITRSRIDIAKGFSALHGLYVGIIMCVCLGAEKMVLKTGDPLLGV